MIVTQAQEMRALTDGLMESARTEMTAIAHQLAEENPEEWEAMQGLRTTTVDAMPGFRRGSCMGSSSP